jgi:hypothetical protein
VSVGAGVSVDAAVRVGVGVLIDRAVRVAVTLARPGACSLGTGVPPQAVNNRLVSVRKARNRFILQTVSARQSRGLAINCTESALTPYFGITEGINLRLRTGRNCGVFRIISLTRLLCGIFAWLPGSVMIKRN